MLSRSIRFKSCLSLTLLIITMTTHGMETPNLDDLYNNYLSNQSTVKQLSTPTLTTLLISIYDKRSKEKDNDLYSGLYDEMRLELFTRMKKDFSKNTPSPKDALPLIAMLNSYEQETNDNNFNDLKTKLSAPSPQQQPIAPTTSTTTSSPSNDTTFRLAPLTDTQMAAGVVGNQYYSTHLLYFRRLHATGHTESEDFLKTIFLYSMFQYYTHEFTGYDMTYNYNDNAIITRKYDLKKFNEFNEFFKKVININVPNSNQKDFSALIPYLTLIDKTAKRFKENALLGDLGIAYQRQKVVVEKITDLVKTTPALQNKLYETDRLAIDLQTMIYHMMKEAYAKFMPQLKNMQPDAGDFIASFTPSFTNKPYYKNILDNIAEYKKPVSKIDGITLPTVSNISVLAL